jgi:signal transduction histidine kinase
MVTTPREAFVSIDLEGVIDQILAQLAGSLESRRSALVLDGVLDPGLEAQSRSILTETVTGKNLSSPGRSSPVAVEYGDDSALHSHGRSAGLRDVDPAEPLMAAELLFHHALPILAEHLDSSRDPIGVARDLHHAIWRRFPPGAIAYVEVLRAKLASAYAESRKRISRDLHDRIAPSLAVVRQRIELATIEDQDRDLDIALASLDSALSEVQSLAFDLREAVGDSDLDTAIRSYIGRTPGRPPIALETHGRQRPVSETVAEEAFAVMIECIRNARRHADHATLIRVTIDWAVDALHITVTDDGSGSTEGSTGTSLGLTGMRERASSIGATSEIEFGPDGTRATLRVPYVLPTPGSA